MNEQLEQRALISFELGEQAFCLDIMCVREIRGWTSVTRLPQAPLYVRGVINLRGVMLPVMDLAERIGFAPVEMSSRSVVIVVQIGENLIGLLVDSVSDILAVGESDIHVPPSIVSNPESAFVRGMFLRDGQMFSEIALPMVAPARADLLSIAA